MTLADYLPIAFMLLLAIVFVAISLLISRFVAPSRPTPEKLAPYESGIIPEIEPAQRFPVQFYLVAMLFVIFDVETIYLYPWAVVFEEIGLFAFGEMMLFIGMLVVGLIYAWRKRVLKWA